MSNYISFQYFELAVISLFNRYILTIGLSMGFNLFELIGFVTGVSMFSSFHSFTCILFSVITKAALIYCLFCYFSSLRCCVSDYVPLRCCSFVEYYFLGPMGLFDGVLLVDICPVFTYSLRYRKCDPVTMAVQTQINQMT